MTVGGEQPGSGLELSYLSLGIKFLILSFVEFARDRKKKQLQSDI
jgi:hypothetical protein